MKEILRNYKEMAMECIMMKISKYHIRDIGKTIYFMVKDF
jgi:hypothetical protein